MAGPEGFDPSLIEAEALLKKMKPRPANLSAARIVYEAGLAVGKQESQALLAAGLSAAPLAASTWKSWVWPTWAGASTSLCVLLLIGYFVRTPQRPTPDYVDNPPSLYRHQYSPGYGSSNYRSPGYSPGYAPGLTSTPQPPVTAEAPIPEMPIPAADSRERNIATVPPASGIAPTTNATPVAHTPKRAGSGQSQASSSQNQSGMVRQGRSEAPLKPQEKKIADYIRERLPSLEGRREIDPASAPGGILEPSDSGSSLTVYGLIRKS